MKILAHRGLWQSAQEKNTSQAIQAAFHRGFGCEIDLRDREEKLVISHDMASAACAAFDQILESWNTHEECMLALDIKACGLLPLLLPQLEGHSNYFCFGMPLCEMLDYIAAGVRVFTRQSEYEPEPLLYEQSQGVWVDYFYDDHAAVAAAVSHLQQGKPVCFVSADLNGRDPLGQWALLKALDQNCLDRLILCTDLVQQAQTFFESGCVE